MLSAAMPASMSQYGTGHRFSSRSVHPLSAMAYLSRYCALFERHTMSTGALNMSGQPKSRFRSALQFMSQYRSVCSLPSRTRKPQPWLKPAEGAFCAFASIRSTIA
jgi:hypothetical protein